MRKHAQNKICTNSCLYGIFPDDRTKWHRIQGTVSALTWGSMPVTSVFLSLFFVIILSSSSDRTFFPVFIFYVVLSAVYDKAACFVKGELPFNVNE